MHDQRKVPVLVTALVAVVGMAIILSGDLNSGTDLRAGSKASAITAAAVARDGAIETPTE